LFVNSPYKKETLCLNKKFLISTSFFQLQSLWYFYARQYVTLEQFQIPLLVQKYAVLFCDIVYKVILKGKSYSALHCKETNYVLIFSSEVTHNDYTCLIICLVLLSINHDHTYFSNSSINPIIPVVSWTHLLLILIMLLLSFVERDND